MVCLINLILKYVQESLINTDQQSLALRKLKKNMDVTGDPKNN